MRKARVFHDVDKDRIITPIFGLRMRPGSFGLAMGSALVGVMLFRVAPFAVGVSVILLGFFGSIALAIYLSFLDPDHRLRESTQLRLLRSAMKHRFLDADDPED